LPNRQTGLLAFHLVLVRRRLGAVSRAARERAGLDQAAIATRFGTSIATISRHEAGLRWVKEVEALVEVYETMCGLPDGELWRRATR
jgi:ribosome-binding protein aMBF1 (putative translation factor)